MYTDNNQRKGSYQVEWEIGDAEGRKREKAMTLYFNN